MLGSELAVGARVRRDAGVAVLCALAVSVAFFALTWLSKETPALNVHQPWQDDPYDVPVSFDFEVLPLLVLLAALRVQLCRRYSVLPARRLIDVLRVCAAAVGVCLFTELGEWISVALGLHRAAWTAATAWQVGVLAVATLVTVAVGVLLGRVLRAVNRTTRANGQPDWLADALTLGLRLSGALGSHRSGAEAALRWTDARVVNRVRSRPVAAAAVLAVVLALPFVTAKLVLEGYPPALLLLSFALPAAGLFALIVLVGRYLRIVAPRVQESPARVHAIVVACSVGPVVFAFHDSLLGSHQTAAGLNALLFGGALIGGSVSLVMQLARQHARNRGAQVDRCG